MKTFEQELESLLNRYSQENGSNTPDFILAQYLMNCLQAWNISVTRREQWYGRPDNRIIHIPHADGYSGPESAPTNPPADVP